MYQKLCHTFIIYRILYVRRKKTKWIVLLFSKKIKKDKIENYRSDKKNNYRDEIQKGAQAYIFSLLLQFVFSARSVTRI